MSRTRDLLLTDLRHTLRELGKDGGLTSPSIYDTAQVIRLAPPAEGIWPALDWLIDQQRADGGWGDPRVPRARDLPTLAAILALHTYGNRRRAREAVQAGLAFLRRQAVHWNGALPEDLTAGLELLLPRLLEEARAVGLDLSPEPYTALAALGARRRRLIAQLKPQAGTTAFHSWEAWGDAAHPELLDGEGSVGHSPAATARWLRAAAGRPELAGEVERAHDYLARAARATGVDIPGVVPTCWPTPHFERVFALHSLYLAGFLNHPALQDVVEPQVDAVQRAFGPHGIGFSDHFAPDGDDTAAAIAVLWEQGRSADAGVLQRFTAGDHYCAWPGELQPSLSVTAHVAHTLRARSGNAEVSRAFMIERQRSDGRWPGDKWNGSWLYTTWRVALALGDDQAAREALTRAQAAILAYQLPDGGWGGQSPNAEETAYGILALRGLQRLGCSSPLAEASIARANRWMLRAYQPFAEPEVTCWLAKEPYRPRRISRTIELSALLSGIEQGS
ncbi:MAG: hypothetical protein OHK0015_05570 [Chloroflexi bacterium OHK40]